MSTGKGFILVDALSGRILRDYPLDGMGWAAVNSSADGQYALIGNFFTGDIVKVRLADGTVVAQEQHRTERIPVRCRPVPRRRAAGTPVGAPSGATKHRA